MAAMPSGFFCFGSVGEGVERDRGGNRNVETLDCAGHVEARHHIAGRARLFPQAFSFRTQYEGKRKRLLDLSQRRRGFTVEADEAADLVGRSAGDE